MRRLSAMAALWRVETCSAACAASLGLLFVTVWFSVLLHELAAAVSWLAVIGGWLAGRDGDRQARWAAPPPGLWAPLVLFFAGSGLSVAFGVAPLRGIRLLLSELLPVGLALAAASLARPAVAWRVVTLFLRAAAVAGAWSIYQLVFQFHGVVDFDHRAHGFWHPGAFVSYGNVMAMTFGLVLGLGFWATRPPALALASGGFAAIGMGLSYTRASWLASGALLFAVSAWRRAVRLLVVLVTVIGLALALPGSDDSHQFAARLRSSFDPHAEKNIDRLVRYRVGGEVVHDYPLLGTGPAGLSEIYPKYARPGAMDNWHLHNTYLQLLAERGPLGLGAWLLLVAWAMVHAFRATRRLEPMRRGLAAGVGLLLAAMLLLGFFNYLWEDWRVRSLTLAFLGLAWSPVVTVQTTQRVIAKPEEEQTGS